MNILILNPILYTSHKNTIPRVNSIKDCMIYNLSLGFKELGHQVFLVAALEYKPMIDEDYEVNVIFIKSNLKNIFLPSVLPLQFNLFTFLLKNKKNFDLIITSEVFSFPSLFAAMINPQGTIIWHELALHTRKMRRIPSLIWYNVIVKLFYTKTLVVTRSVDAKIFINRYLRKVSGEIVEHGINLKKFEFSRNKKDQFIVVSQLIPRKNIESIILKFKEFKKSEIYRDYKLLIVGSGELAIELQNLVINEQLVETVVFLGFKTHLELNGLISESKAMLIDTKQDNNMVSIPEAIVSGTPIVTNTIPTNAFMIEENQLGIVNNNWGVQDLIEVVKYNKMFVENCINFRDKLSTVHTARKLIDCFLANKE